MSIGDLLHGGSALASFVVGFLHHTVVVGLRDDLVVDASHDVFDRHAAVGTLWNAASRMILRLDARRDEGRAADEHGRGQQNRSGGRGTERGAACERRSLRGGSEKA